MVSVAKRTFAACQRLDDPLAGWIAVGVVLGFLTFDSIPLAVAIGAALWAGLRRAGPRGDS